MAFTKWMSINFLLILSMSSGCSSGPIAKAALDDEVRRLCAIDGGIKVYETVMLPADKFNQWGQVNFYRPTQMENSLGDAYFVAREVTVYRVENPQMERTQYRIVRKLDGKELGSSIQYGRGGGDMPGPWHDSSFTCPGYNEAGINILLKSIFVSKN